MMKNFEKYWQVFWKFRKIQLMRIMEFRLNFFFWSGVTILWSLFNWFFMDLLVGAGGGSIAGWNEDEIFVLVGVFTILDGSMWSFMYHNMADYTRKVFSGEFSSALLKPIDAQFTTLTQNNTYTNVFRILIGFGIVAKSLQNLQITPSFAQILGFLGILMLSLTFLYFFWFILATLSFWVNRINNINEIIPNLQRIWRFPRTIFTGILSTIFTVILPIGLIGSLPAEVLLDKINWAIVIRFGYITIITIVFGRWFFKYSIKKYSAVGG